MKPSRWILWGLLAVVACSKTTVHGVTPIAPEAGFFPVVESLQPTFRWEPVADSNARYDFVIFESYDYPVVGRKVYYREGLQEPEHTLEVSLQPDRKYYWSVRVRHGEHVSEWSRFDFHRPGAYGSQIYEEFPLFRFETPDK